MPDGRGRRIVVGAAVEAAVWYGAALAFLAAYVGIFHAPAASVLPHLHLLTDGILALALARLALASLPLPRRGLRALSAVLLTAAFAALLLFYGLALLGLKSWGRITSWELVATYLPQAPSLLDAAGFSLAAVLAVLGVAAAALLWGTWVFLRRLDWVPPAAAAISRVPLAFAALGLLLIVTLDVGRVMAVPPVAEQEPISLAIYPAHAAMAMETNPIDRAAWARRDLLEDAAVASYRPNPNAVRRNVVLIVSDALRADHMGIYGYGRDTTPHLSRMNAAGEVRVAPAVHTACSESLCGLLSLASSRYVHQFSSRMFVLQKVLKLHGYRTVMILGGDHTHFYGLREQYGHVDVYYDGSQAGDRYMNDDRLVVDRVGELPTWNGEPVMMQLHLMSSHLLGKRHAGSMAYLPAANYFFPANRTENGKVAAAAINFYDDGVREADSVIAAILESLRKKGYLANAVVAITADHGEGLGEHGLWAHQNSVYEEALRVPFLLISYGYHPEGNLAAHPLPSQVDIAPTLLQELHIPQPASWAGRALQLARADDFAYFEQGPLAGLLDRRDPSHPWKYWEDRAHGTSFAFDLGRDAAESRNVIGEVAPALKRDWQLAMLPLRAQYVANPWK